jgi:hypothetical protein
MRKTWALACPVFLCPSARLGLGAQTRSGHKKTPTSLRFSDFALIRLLQRGRDSNPRNSFPFTHFPGVLLQPLGHLSVKLECKNSSLRSETEDFFGVGGGDLSNIGLGQLFYCCQFIQYMN